MKTMKKIFCLVMAMALIAALGVCALADDGASITVSNPVNGVTYTLYKVFSATEAFAGTTMTGIQYTATQTQRDAMYDDVAVTDDEGTVTVPACPFTFTAINDADLSQGYYVSSTATGSDVGKYLEAHISDAAYGITATKTAQTADASTKSIVWSGLDYGYYLVSNNLESVAEHVEVTGSAVTVDSTTPNATIKVKNEATPLSGGGDDGSGSLVSKTDGEYADGVGGTYAIGDTVTYTISFYTSNTYTAATDVGDKGNSYPIYQYVVCDNLPNFLTDVSIDSVKVDGNAITKYATVNTNKNDKTSFADDKNIVIQWVDDTTYAALNGGTVSTAQANPKTTTVAESSYSFLYKAGAQVTITYKGTVTDAAVAGDNVNTATVTVDPFSTTVPGSTTPTNPTPSDPEDPDSPDVPDTPVVPDPTNPEDPNYPDDTVPNDSPWYKSGSSTIYTYAFGIMKVDGTDLTNGTTTPLSGAQFTFGGYNLADKYETIKDSAGNELARVYTVTSKKAATDTSVATIETGVSGVVIVRGVESGAVELTEIKAPNGYNKLSGPFSVTPVKDTETTTTTAAAGTKDEDGNITSTLYETKTATTTATINEATMIATAKGASTTIANNRGAELPSTGGMGVTLFYIIGGIMVVGAGVLLITKKRMSANG